MAILHRLRSAFVDHSLDSLISIVSKSRISSLWSVSVAVQTSTLRLGHVRATVGLDQGRGSWS